LHLVVGHVVEDSQFIDAEPVLRVIEFSESLDPTPAQLGRLVTEMGFHRVTNFCALVGAKSTQIINGLGCEDDLKCHSG
jgi:hypothetical protein